MKQTTKEKNGVAFYLAIAAFIIGIGGLLVLDQYCLNVLEVPGGFIGCGPALSGN